MRLEDIHEAWVRHADGTKESLRGHHDGATTGTATRMLLPSFLQAFTSLARTKYCNLRDGKGGNHLLLGDVFDNITNPTVSQQRFLYGLHPATYRGKKEKLGLAFWVGRYVHGRGRGRQQQAHAKSTSRSYFPDSTKDARQEFNSFRSL